MEFVEVMRKAKEMCKDFRYAVTVLYIIPVHLLVGALCFMNRRKQRKSNH